MDTWYTIESPAAATAAIQQLLAAPRPWDFPSTSKQLSRHLKAIQHALQQASILLPIAQIPFIYFAQAFYYIN